MELSEYWLREWVNPPINTEQLAEQLTMAGLQVDSVTPVVTAPFAQVVVGVVEAVEPHPNADRLKVCRVNIGQANTLQIVCGASNVSAGIRVPTALVGATLPSGVVIKAAKLRGVESAGMLCSATELGLATDSTGIWHLPADAPIGEAVYRYLQLGDHRLKIDLTPNRGDCLSVQGLAREVSAFSGSKWCPPFTITPIVPQIDIVLPVTVVAEVDCPRYCGRVIAGINPQAATPLWLQEKLTRSGIRSLGPVVDVTNYILLELGQPLHAFDKATLNTGVWVRSAQAGESLTLLNGRTIHFSAETNTTNTLVIADAHQPIALAGIMGGAATAVTQNTTDIFLESAFFTPQALAGQARRYGLATDASHRFERGVDFEETRLALERATQLLLAIVGGQAGPVIEVAQPVHLPARKPILLREQRITHLLGMPLTTMEVTQILERLGMKFTVAEAGWWVTPPSYRFDIQIEVDLIEELMRVYGYNRLPSRSPLTAVTLRPYPQMQATLAALKQRLIAHGYQEVITYSFVDPALQTLLNPMQTPMALANPIAADMSVMRTQLWPGLIQAVRYNQARQQSRLRLFEHGLNFVPQADGSLQQKEFLAGIATGSLYPPQWALSNEPVDFFSVKADLLTLLGNNAAGNAAPVCFQAAEHPALHPGQSARLERAGIFLGWMGALHPQIIQQLDLQGPVIVFELSMAAFLPTAIPQFAPLSRFPAVRRDLALVVTESVPAQTVLDHIQQAGIAHLCQVQLFDDYRGPGIETGYKSLAVSLYFQDSTRTFEDVDIDQRIEHLLKHLQTLHIRLRD